MMLVQENHAMPVAPKRLEGLTLVEVLVTITILMLILGLSFQGLNTLLLVREQVPKDISHWSDLERVFDRIEYDFTNLSLVAPIAPNGQRLYPLMLDPQKKYGALAPLMLSRLSRQNDAGGDGQLVGYQLTGNKLELLIWPNLYLPLVERHHQPRIYPLLTQVIQFKAEVLDGSSKTWKSVYPENTNQTSLSTTLDTTTYTPAKTLVPLPRALKITLQRQGMPGPVNRIFDRVY